MSCRYDLIISSAEAEIGEDVGYFTGTLEVSFVIASLEQRFKYKCF
jgi:hypothetical protein